jgi:hypothetical protein
VKDWQDRALEIAAFRYRIIAGAAESEGLALSAAIAEAARRSYCDPRGKQVQVVERTLWRWLANYKAQGLSGLMPKRRSDSGQLRAMPAEVLERCIAQRRDNPARPTKTMIDILERQKVIEKGSLARSTLDRHLLRLGESRRNLRSLGTTTYRKILTTVPLELVIADFHHGPYVRMAGEDRARKALLLVFIDLCGVSGYVESRFKNPGESGIAGCATPHN